MVDRLQERKHIRFLREKSADKMSLEDKNVQSQPLEAWTGWTAGESLGK